MLSTCDPASRFLAPLGTSLRLSSPAINVKTRRDFYPYASLHCGSTRTRTWDVGFGDRCFATKLWTLGEYYSRKKRHIKWRHSHSRFLSYYFFSSLYTTCFRNVGSYFLSSSFFSTRFLLRLSYRLCLLSVLCNIAM